MFGNQDERKEDADSVRLLDSSNEDFRESAFAQGRAPVFTRRNALLCGFLASLFTAPETVRAAEACGCLPAPDCNALCTYGGAPLGDGTQACDCNSEPAYAHPASGVAAGTYNTVTVNPEGHVTLG